MPHFLVTKLQDAYIQYQTVVEAIDEQNAKDLVRAWTYEGEWVANGVVNEYDHSELSDEDPEIVEPSYKLEEGLTLNVSAEDRNMILASLRLWNDVVNDGAEYINEGLIDIATNGGVSALMDDNAIDALCESINHG